MTDPDHWDGSHQKTKEKRRVRGNAVADPDEDRDQCGPIPSVIR